MRSAVIVSMIARSIAKNWSFFQGTDELYGGRIAQKINIAESWYCMIFPFWLMARKSPRVRVNEEPRRGEKHVKYGSNSIMLENHIKRHHESEINDCKMTKKTPHIEEAHKKTFKHN